MTKQRIRSCSSRTEVLEFITEYLKNDTRAPLVFLDGEEWGGLPMDVNNQESVDQLPCKTRYLFYDFQAWLEFSDGKARVCIPDPASKSLEGVEQIEQCTDPWKAVELFRKLTPGYHTGYFSYDLKNYREKLISENPDSLRLPDLWIGYPKEVIRIPHEKTVREPLNDAAVQEVDTHCKPGISKQEYVQIVESAKRKIHEGDYYEINLTVLFSGSFDGEAFELYRRMSGDGMQPFSAFMRVSNVQICSASPERFLRKNGDQLYSSPMKGTAARDSNPEQDISNKKQLQESEKERAENLMIVDLVRNDFSRVCRPGSVNVNRLFEISSYSTVHQMTSTISGQIQSNKTPEETLAACFPMGSMTGAPKIKALEDIERLESYRRGVYSGAIGWMSPEGNFDFNVVIRSAMCLDDGTFYYPAGSAITSDADPEQEWEEILLKTKVLQRK